MSPPEFHPNLRLLICRGHAKVMSNYIPLALLARRDGLRGLELAASGVYDLLILDRMFPGQDGLDVLKELGAKGSRRRPFS